MAENQNTSTTSPSVNKVMRPNSLLKLYGKKDGLKLLVSNKDFNVERDIGGGLDDQAIPGVNYLLYWWKGGIKHTVEFSTILSNLPYTIDDIKNNPFCQDLNKDLDKGNDDEYNKIKEEIKNLSNYVQGKNNKTSSLPDGGNLTTIYANPEFYARYGGFPPQFNQGELVNTIRTLGISAERIISLLANFNKVGSKIEPAIQDTNGGDPGSFQRQIKDNIKKEYVIGKVDMEQEMGFVLKEGQGGDRIVNIADHIKNAKKVGTTIKSKEDMIANYFSKDKASFLDMFGEKVDFERGIIPKLELLDTFVVSNTSVFTRPPAVHLLLFNNNQGNAYLSFIGVISEISFSDWIFGDNGVPMQVNVKMKLKVLDYVTSKNTVNFAFKKAQL
jgi:hypothetical protein